MRGPGFAAACVLLVLLPALLPAAAATTFVVTNSVPSSPGGQRFDTDLGVANMRSALSDAASFIQDTLNKSPPKNFDTVTLIVESNPGGVAATGGSTIHLSAEYVANYLPGNAAALMHEIVGVLYHESTHVWQNNNGNYGSDPYFSGTIEGIADWIRLKAGYASTTWSPRARGGNWYDGYTTTAYFLDWINSTQNPDFVNLLNQKMANPWTNDFFLQITGITVDQLWQAYQNSI